MLRAQQIVFVLAVIGCGAAAFADDDTVEPAWGVVAGRIVYEPDIARPWRFQRYYVKQRTSGELAEAVVALRGRGLEDIRSPASPEASRVIDQYNYQFVPETTAIRAGESIRFTNSDATTHNIKSVASIAPFNVNLGADDEYIHRFERAGGMRTPVTLGCVFHGGMRAWIYVFDHPFFAVTGEDGRFRFEDVPPGRYTLEVVHPAGGLRWKQRVLVTAGETVDVSVRLTPDHKTLK